MLARRCWQPSGRTRASAARRQSKTEDKVAGPCSTAQRHRRCERARSRGVSVIAAAPFNSGLLAREWPPDDAHYDYGPVPPDVLERARGLARESRRAGLTLPKAAMRFPLRHPAVVTVVSGMGSDAHVASAADWMR